MKVAVIGSRNLVVDTIGDYLPKETTRIVSGGARGIDQCAKEYAFMRGLEFTEFLPKYKQFGKYAPIRRNIQIVEFSDMVLAFWDGKSRGTKFVIEYAKKTGKAVEIVYL